MDEDVIGRIVMGLVMVASGVLVMRVARAAASGRLGRDQVAGIRTASTLASDAAWLGGCLAMLGLALHGTVVGGRAAREVQEGEQGQGPERHQGR